jgi:hypothetical protein
LEQHQKLTQKLRGHYGYYGITGNYPSLKDFREEVRKIWRRWLSRRRRDGNVTWPEFYRLEKRYSLPPARVVHGLRSSVAKSLDEEPDAFNAHARIRGGPGWVTTRVYPARRKRSEPTRGRKEAVALPNAQYSLSCRIDWGGRWRTGFASPRETPVAWFSP